MLETFWFTSVYNALIGQNGHIRRTHRNDYDLHRQKRQRGYKPRF